MIVRAFVFALAVLMVGAAPASARPAEVTQHLPGAVAVGAARYSVLSLALFDAALWAETRAFSWDRPFALSLTYQRAFSADALTRRTMQEMARRTSADAAALTALRGNLGACFADVAAGDRITGVSLGANRARFYLNGVRRCDLEWPGFQRAFFGIWLEGEGGARGFSARLRGQA